VGKSSGLAKEQLRALDRLSAIGAIDGFYLAGGSAIAIHLGHRRSEDLDLFSMAPDADLEPFRAAARAPDGAVEVIDASDVMLKLRVADALVDVVRYPYPPLHDLARGPRGIRIAALPDLAAMKLAAIAKRGIRRDFWDLEAILRSGLTLAEAAATYLERFRRAEPDLYHVARALTYFDDAEKDPAFPSGLTPRKWTAIKRRMTREAPSLLHLATR
jgi:hypothetical protein